MTLEDLRELTALVARRERHAMIVFHHQSNGIGGAEKCLSSKRELGRLDKILKERGIEISKPVPVTPSAA